MAIASPPARQRLSAEDRDAVRRLVDQRRRQLLQDAPPEETLAKIDRELDRRTTASPAVLGHRQREVIGLMVDGLSVTEIADSLSLDPRSVRGHIRSAGTKLGARTQCHTVVLALARGLV